MFVTSGIQEGYLCESVYVKYAQCQKSKHRYEPISAIVAAAAVVLHFNC
jgi:hypothetical protein